MKQSFFARYGMHVLLVTAFMFPIILMGTIKALNSNKNDVREWLPETFQETADYDTFRARFENETFVLASWDGCTLTDQRLNLFASKIDPPNNPPCTPDGRRLFQKVITGASTLEQLTELEDETTGERGLGLAYDVALARLTGSLIGPDRRPRKPDGSLVDPNQPDERITCAVLTVTEAGKEQPKYTMAAISEAASECNVTPEALHLGGTPVDNAALDSEGERMVVRLAALCGVVGFGLCYYYLRSLRLSILVFLGAVYSAGISLACVWATGGAVDSILLTMPAVVYTAALSGGIHIVNYYKHAAGSEGMDGAADRAVLHALLPCTLSATTTTIGLVSLWTSELIPIRKFGYYSGLGVMATLFAIFLFLPAALACWAPRSEGDKDAHEPTPRELAQRRRLRAFSQWIVGHPAVIWTTFLVLLSVCSLGLFRINTSINLMNLFSSSAKIRQDYAWLERHIGPLVPMELVLRLDKANCNLNMLDRMELVSRIQKSIESLDEVGSTLSTVTFGPSLEVPRAGRGIGALGKALGLSERAKREAYAKQIEKHRDTYLEGDYLAEAGGEELWRINVRVVALHDIDYGRFIDNIRSRVDPILQDEDQAGAQGILGVTYTGLTPLIYKAQRSLLDSLSSSFGWAFLTIAAVMALVFFSVTAGLLTMLPNVWPIAVVFGTLGWLGIAVDIGTMMTASVAMGVCVDDTVHLATWFRRGTKKMGFDRRKAVLYAYENCAGPMYQSSVIVALGLLTFALSNFMPTVRFGLLMFILLAVGLAGDLILTPVMLSGKLGYFFMPRSKRRAFVDELELDEELPIEDEPQPAAANNGTQHTRHGQRQPLRTHTSRPVKPS